MGALNIPYAEIVSALVEGVVIVNAEGCVEFCNEAAHLTLSLELGELLATAPNDGRPRFYREDGTPLEPGEHPAHVVLRTGEPLSGIVLRVSRPDGSLATIRANSIPVLRAGRPQFVICTFTEVDEAPNPIFDTEAPWRAIFETSQDGCWDWDLLKSNVFYSPSWKGSLGFEESEIGDAPNEWRDRIHPEDKPLTLNALDACLAGITPLFEGEHRLRCKSGQWKRMLVRGAVTARDSAGRPLRFIAGHTERPRPSADPGAEILNSSPSAVAVLDLSAGWNILNANQHWLTLIGYDRDQVIGRSALNLGLLTTDQARGLNDLFLAQGSLREYEFEFCRKTGEQRIGLISMELLHAEGQELAIASVVDITERKRAEQTLVETGRLYRTLTEDSTMGAFVITDGKLVYANGALETIFGYERGAIARVAILDLIERKDRAVCARMLRQLLSGGATSGSGVFQVICTDGSLKKVKISGTSGEVEHRPAIIGNMVDVTALSRVEEGLRRSKEQFSSLSRCISDVIWCVDLSGHITYVSPSVEQMYGRTMDECLSLSLKDLTTTAQQEACAKMLASELSRASLPNYDPDRIVSFESEHVRKDGTVFSGEMRCGILWTDTGQPSGLIGVSREVARDKDGSHMASPERSELIDRVGGIAHDFNNLLTVINGHAKLALAASTDDDPLRKHFVEIERAGDRAAGLTRQLHAVSRGQMHEARIIDLDRVVAGLDPILRRILGESVALRLVLAGGTALVQADPNELEQLIINLAVNSLDAMPDGGEMTIEVAVEQHSKTSPVPDLKPGRYVILKVSDTRKGMDIAPREQIRDRSFMTEQPGIDAELGLRAAKGIAGQCGGAISVERAPGAGTALKVYFPALSRPTDAWEGSVETSALRGTETILVVEDQQDVREFAAEALRQYGYHVVEAASAREAVELCLSGAAFDLVLTGVAVPGTGDLALVEQLTKLQPGLKSLLMTGLSADAIAQRERPASSVQISKPFSPEALAGKVRQALGPPPAAARILVVDDEPGVRLFLRTVLENAHYEVLEASNGKEALTQTADHRVQLVITDLVMPELEGIETIQALRRSLPEVPIIAMSGAFEGQFLRVAKAMGAKAILTKPLDPELLLAQVAEVLAGRVDPPSFH